MKRVKTTTKRKKKTFYQKTKICRFCADTNAEIIYRDFNTLKHFVTDRGFSVLIVGVELLRLLHDLLELRVRNAGDVFHNDGLVHLCRNYDADTLLVQVTLLGGCFTHGLNRVGG